MNDSKQLVYRLPGHPSSHLKLDKHYCYDP